MTVSLSSSLGLIFCVLVVGLTSLSGCSGGNTDLTSKTAQIPPPAEIATANIEFHSELPPENLATLYVKPSFHLAPVVLDSPNDADVGNTQASAHRAAHQQNINAATLPLAERAVTIGDIQKRIQIQRESYAATAAAGLTPPPAISAAVATYTPAQVRAAYGLPTIPSGTYSTAQAASLGAKQTIYIVDAMHNPNIATELSAFNQKFGLPTCTTKSIAVNTSLPLPAPSASACDLSIVYSNTAGVMTTAAPAYDAGWATEIALDVQWAHAIAPLARIVVIEAPDASVTSLTNAVKLANSMGPGIVSMSFGVNEGSWSSTYDNVFAGTGMTYLAATGDAGAAVEWPSVSFNVLAVGGTSLTYNGSGTRSEIAWSQTGGGVSAYVATPKYQTSSVPGMGTAARRTVADVAFNADPSTGQFVASIPAGSSAVSWISAGGTSLSTPQWAGLMAIANANRLLAAKPLLGSPHALLYSQIAAVSGNYSSAFLDITKGSDGSCATCTAKAGYDHLTGLGTPNVTSLLNLLSNTSVAPVPPSINAATISGETGTPLTYTVSASSNNPLSYTLTGAPAGMSISAAGILSWNVPVVGSYSVTVTAKDTTTNLSAQALISIKITAPPPPVISTASINGEVGKALNFTASASAANPLTYTMSGAPSGMTISSSGQANWATPVLGKYSITITAKDSKTSLAAQAVYTVTIVNPPAPTVAATTINSEIGKALSFTVTTSASNPLSYTLTGAPSGMSINTGGVISWSAPILGKYSVTVLVKDTKTGLTGQGIYTINIINPPAPSVTSATINGKVGVSLNFTPQVSASNTVSYSMTGAPTGMSIAASGIVTWATPVMGTYNVFVTAKDSKTGLSGQGTYTVVIATVGPVINAPAMLGVAGKPLSGSIVITDPGTSFISVSMSGVPLGMSMMMSGMTITTNWASPVTGTYSIKIVVTDAAGLTATATVPITITAK
ncbi:putative Ig domain-containing protein [Undibacterium sp. Di24W]|uniref:putative Ig domain-containing protein n=1 Tax=Undibacterium sp. Di24W TaxID=3413033 RepID=UPI003BF2FAE9